MAKTTKELGAAVMEADGKRKQAVYEFLVCLCKENKIPMPKLQKKSPLTSDLAQAEKAIETVANLVQKKELRGTIAKKEIKEFVGDMYNVRF